MTDKAAPQVRWQTLRAARSHFTRNTSLAANTKAHARALERIEASQRPMRTAKALLDRQPRPRSNGSSHAVPTTVDAWSLRQSRTGLNGGCARPLSDEEAAAATTRREPGRSEQGSAGGRCDLSDVQELRARLLRRDHWCDPHLNRSLARLGAEAASGRLTWERFNATAALLLDTKRLSPTLSAQWRKAEAAAATT